MSLFRILPRFAAPNFTLTATTTGAQTVTINRLTLSVPTTIHWGDGTSTAHAAGVTTAITHDYAGAGTWAIRVPYADRITQLDLRDAKLGGLDTAQLTGVVTYFYITNITNSTIRSADMVDWRPTTWYLYALSPTGTYSIGSADMVDWRPADWRLYSLSTGTYSISSADMVDWRPTTWILYSMPAGTYSISSADLVDWRPAYWWLYSLPAAGSSYTFASACMQYWLAATNIRCDNLGLSQATVDAILWDIYQGFAARTGTGGTINVGGTNAAPSGTYQAATSCPVTVATPGKETAHELVNDGCNVSSKHWSTVTITV